MPKFKDKAKIFFFGVKPDAKCPFHRGMRSLDKSFQDFRQTARIFSNLDWSFSSDKLDRLNSRKPMYMPISPITNKQEIEKIMGNKNIILETKEKQIDTFVNPISNQRIESNLDYQINESLDGKRYFIPELDKLDEKTRKNDENNSYFNTRAIENEMAAREVPVKITDLELTQEEITQVIVSNSKTSKSKVNELEVQMIFQTPGNLKDQINKNEGLNRQYQRLQNRKADDLVGHTSIEYYSSIIHRGIYFISKKYDCKDENRLKEAKIRGSNREMKKDLRDLFLLLRMIKRVVKKTKESKDKDEPKDTKKSLKIKSYLSKIELRFMQIIAKNKPAKLKKLVKYISKSISEVEKLIIDKINKANKITNKTKDIKDRKKLEAYLNYLKNIRSRIKNLRKKNIIEEIILEYKKDRRRKNKKIANSGKTI